ncbi:MAG: GcvT family protein [Rubrobacter sp.]
MRSSAAVVIVGAGIVGCSAAEHLTRLGWRDVVVLDQGPLFEAGGSTSHAPGLVFQTNPSRTMTRLASYGVERYSELRFEGEPCFYQVGGLEVATTPERWKDLSRRHGLATSWGVEAHLLSPEECVEKSPLLDTRKLHGGLFVPSDGIAKGVRVAGAMAREAERGGAEFYGETEVTGIEIGKGRVRAVETSRGLIQTEVVLSCAGMWGPRIGRMAGAFGPMLTPMQHQYVWTTPVPGLEAVSEEADHVILRHQDHSMYFRQHGERYGVGSYRHRPMPLASDRLGRYEAGEVMPSIWDFTPEDFEGPWEESKRMLPALGGAEIERGINGLFSFTPDGGSLLGESREVKGFWMCEAVWVTHAAGAARMISEWMTDGAPSLDPSGLDVHRFDEHQRSPAYVLARSSRSFREVYDIIHPRQPMDDPRPLRTSPFYVRQRELGAYFLEASGWERPQWYAANEPLLARYDIPDRDEWGGRYWSAVVGAEHLATRERGAIFDLATLKKAEVTGPGALRFLQRLNTNDLDRPVGSVTYTPMLDEKAGVRSDITVARLGEESFRLGLNSTRDIEWLERHLPPDGYAQVRDITSGTCCVGVWGPAARELVQGLSPDDLSNEAFGFFRARRIYVGEIPVVALRVSYVGELGWELYAPADMGLRLWDLLRKAGEPLGVIAAGRGAFEGLRLEKGYRAWGTDMTTEHDPYEAGLGFAVKPDKGDFIGRQALLKRREEGHRRKLVCLILDDPAVVLMGSEPVLSEGCPVGYVTSAGYGYSVERSIAYAWGPPELAEEGTKVEIEYFGVRHGASVASEPLFDPAMKRMRG